MRKIRNKHTCLFVGRYTLGSYRTLYKHYFLIFEWRISTLNFESECLPGGPPSCVTYLSLVYTHELSYKKRAHIYIYKYIDYTQTLTIHFLISILFFFLLILFATHTYSIKVAKFCFPRLLDLKTKAVAKKKNIPQLGEVILHLHMQI